MPLDPTSPDALPSRAVHVARAASSLPAFVKVSLACHAGAAAATLASPALWPWSLGAVAANHLVLTGAGLWPRSTWLGANWSRLPAAAAARREVGLTIDDGPDPEVTPQVLDRLDEHGLRATFFCIAEAAMGEQRLCREIVARGHSVQNHTHRHSHRFSLLGPAALRREIGSAQATLADITGVEPRFFRAPAGLRNPFLEPVLKSLDLRLVSWTRRGFDTVRGDAGRVLASLDAGLAAGAILLLHDGHAARTPQGRAVLLDVLPQLAARLRARGLAAVTLPAAFAAAAAIAAPAPAAIAASASAETTASTHAFKP